MGVAVVALVVGCCAHVVVVAVGCVGLLLVLHSIDELQSCLCCCRRCCLLVALLCCATAPTVGSLRLWGWGRGDWALLHVRPYIPTLPSMPFVPMEALLHLGPFVPLVPFMLPHGV